MGDHTRTMRESLSDDPGRTDKSGVDILITVPMKPRGKQRARRARNARMYTPKETRVFENDFARYMRERMPVKKLKGLLRLDVLAFIQRPKRLMRRKDPDGPIFCGVTPDEDNILKAVQDSAAEFMEGSDACVAHGQCTKFYTEKNGQPRILLRIRSLQPGTGERAHIHRAMFGNV